MDAVLILAFALLFALACMTHLLHRITRRHAQQPSEQPARTPASERVSAIMLGLAHGASLVAAILIAALGHSHLALGHWVGWLGLGMMALGLGLQLWAMRSLGAYFTLTLRAAEAQPLLEGGPYRWVRHPGYAGQILVWLGLGLATREPWSILGISLVIGAGYAFRIYKEEAMLEATLGAAWERYARSRSRLIPKLL